jgi:hypothetical protein
MKPVNKLSQPRRPARRTRKTKEDFLRWLQKRRGSKPAVETQGAPANRAASRALMVWADDGGAI